MSVKDTSARRALNVAWCHFAVTSRLKVALHQHATLQAYYRALTFTVAERRCINLYPFQQARWRPHKHIKHNSSVDRIRRHLKHLSVFACKSAAVACAPGLGDLAHTHCTPPYRELLPQAEVHEVCLVVQLLKNNVLPFPLMKRSELCLQQTRCGLSGNELLRLKRVIGHIICESVHGKKLQGKKGNAHLPMEKMRDTCRTHSAVVCKVCNCRM